MFYWVKSPDGEETDYNANELRKALEEGRVQPAWPARADDQSTWSNVVTVLEHAEVEPESEAPAVKYASLVCGRCKSRLRLELPLKEAGYPCPECDTLYQCSKVSEEPLVYLMMPDLQQYEAPAEGTPPPRQNPG